MEKKCDVQIDGVVYTLSLKEETFHPSRSILKVLNVGVSDSDDSISEDGFDGELFHDGCEEYNVQMKVSSLEVELGGPFKEEEEEGELKGLMDNRGEEGERVDCDMADFGEKGGKVLPFD